MGESPSTDHLSAEISTDKKKNEQIVLNLYP